MRITIDNLDGLGAMDYSSCVSESGAITIHRKLNTPSSCNLALDLAASRLRAPVRKGRVVVSRDDGTVLFTGYLATEPELVYAGEGTTGTAFLLRVKTISDEWLLDRQGAGPAVHGLGQSGVTALGALTARAGTGVAMSSTGSSRSLGFLPSAGDSVWSANAATLAESTACSYRVVGGVVALQPAGTVTHLIGDNDGELDPATMEISQTRSPVNDVTISGAIEPATFLSESFMGDGSTNLFSLTETPFRGTTTALLEDAFDATALDRGLWSIGDPGSHLSITSAGLTVSGGNGLDGQTTLTALNPIEIGGTLILELRSVRLQSASDGVLCGLYSGDVSRANCFAGYSVRSSNGVTKLTAIVDGEESGAAFTLQDGHTYTLRVRVHCAEMQRVNQIYYAVVAGTAQSFGGGLVEAPVELVFDLQDMGASSNTPANLLYAGRVDSSPASCSFVPVNSVQLSGSIGSCAVSQAGSAWVTKTSAAGVRSVQLSGGAAEGVDCMVAGNRVTFLPGRIPQAGELLTISYRTRQRSIARMEDTQSVAEEAAGGIAGTAQWQGSVLNPPARSSVDCESAALAVLSVGTEMSAGRSGRYVASNPDDIWPGDVVAMTRAGHLTYGVTREVTLLDEGSSPEIVTYTVTFASEWAQSLGSRLSDQVARDATLPSRPVQGGAAALPDSLQNLALVSATGTTLQVDTGVAPPAGGGFEVRSRDGGFGSGAGVDLVLRSPVRDFSLPRTGQVERFYVRMYDGSDPPLYSRFSSAIFADIPVG